VHGSTCRCGCTDPRGASVHAIVAALAVDDLDHAIEGGLLVCEPCPGCSSDCTASVLAVRDARQDALAARERFRAREARLARRAEERAARRTTPSAPVTGGGETRGPALPTAAALALARAKAKAQKQH